MKRCDLLRHLSANGCVLLREGGRHSWWHNPGLNKRSAVLVITRSTTISPERFPAISGFPIHDPMRTMLIRTYVHLEGNGS